VVTRSSPPLGSSYWLNAAPTRVRVGAGLDSPVDVRSGRVASRLNDVSGSDVAPVFLDHFVRHLICVADRRVSARSPPGRTRATAPSDAVHVIRAGAVARIGLDGLLNDSLTNLFVREVGGRKTGAEQEHAAPRHHRHPEASPAHPRTLPSVRFWLAASLVVVFVGRLLAHRPANFGRKCLCALILAWWAARSATPQRKDYVRRDAWQPGRAVASRWRRRETLRASVRANRLPGVCLLGSKPSCFWGQRILRLPVCQPPMKDTRYRPGEDSRHARTSSSIGRDRSTWSLHDAALR